jgi:hypothetical protein
MATASSPGPRRRQARRTERATRPHRARPGCLRDRALHVHGLLASTRQGTGVARALPPPRVKGGCLRQRPRDAREGRPPVVSWHEPAERCRWATACCWLSDTVVDPPNPRARRADRWEPASRPAPGRSSRRTGCGPPGARLDPLELHQPPDDVMHRPAVHAGALLGDLGVRRAQFREHLRHPERVGTGRQGGDDHSRGCARLVVSLAPS